MSRNKVIFDVLANSSQYKATMQGVEKTTNETSRAIKASFAISAAAIGGTLTAFAKYETMLIKVGKTADIQGKELNDFGKEITNLSQKIPLSTNQLLELAASAAQLGVKGKDNIVKFTSTMAKLGTATNIVGEEGSQAVARLLNITGEGVQTVDRFASVITRLGNNIAASEGEILSMASRVGKATAQFDLGTTAVLGISAALKEIGIEAELGGSTIGRAFSEIQNAVFKGGESLATFSHISGLTGKEIKEIFEKDATQAFQIFIESLNKLPAEQVATSMEAMGLEGVRLREVIGTLAKRSDILANSLALASEEAQKQTALDEEFNRAVVSLENSFKFMINEVVNLASAMGKDLAPEAKEIIDDITSLIRGIREFNEVTGGAVTNSIVMAAKVSALVIAFNKLKNVLLLTGLFSGKYAVALGIANTATQSFSITSALGAKANNGLALSFGRVATASRTALIAINNFKVGLGALVGGLFIAIDLGRKLGKVLGDLGEANNVEEELVSVRKKLNTLLEIRARLEERIAKGEIVSDEKLAKLDKEIQKQEGTIKVLERLAKARKKANEPLKSTQDEQPNFAEATKINGNGEFKSAEEEKTDILIKEIQARIEASKRESELLRGIEQGLSAESIKLAEDTNNQLNAIAKKKIELEKINLDIAKAGVNENEKAILELKKSAAEEELMFLESQFAITQEKKAEQEAEDMEARIAAKEILNQAFTEQELLFLEEKRLRDEENRAIDLELQAVQNEEDLIFLQEKLMTEQQVKDQIRQEDLKKQADAQNTKLKNELKFGKAIGGMHTFFQSEEVKGVQTTLSSIREIKTKDGSAAGKAQKAFAIADTAIKIPQAAFSAFTSLAGIPIVGPVLGAIAAAAAVATGVQQLNSIRSKPTPSYAVGTDFVPNDTMAQIHAGEAIIPAQQNQFLQSGDLVLGSPDALNKNSNNTNESSILVNLDFTGSQFNGVTDDQFINDTFEKMAVGINEGRLAGFEGAKLSVTGGQ